MSGDSTVVRGTVPGCANGVHLMSGPATVADNRRRVVSHRPSTVADVDRRTGGCRPGDCRSYFS